MAKRRKGTGTVRKRKDGRWEGRLSLENGKTRSVYGKTMREVNDKLRELERQKGQGMDLTVKPQTVGDFLNNWLELTVKESCQPKTYESYEQIVRCHLVPNLGKFRLDALRPEPIRRMLQDLHEKERSERTRQYVVDILSRALNQALADGLVARNVARQVKRPRPKNPKRKLFTKEMVGVFLVTVQGHRLEALYHLALRLGLRRGELIALKWEDIDLQECTLSVTKSKTNAGIRNLPLSDDLVDMLLKHQSYRNEERDFVGDKWKEHGLVFPSMTGTPLSPRNLVRHFHSTRKKANLPKIRFHDLRHICASLLVIQGVHPRVIMEILGQSSINVAMEIYAHIELQQKKHALRTLDAILGIGLFNEDENLLKDRVFEENEEDEETDAPYDEDEDADEDEDTDEDDEDEDADEDDEDEDADGIDEDDEDGSDGYDYDDENDED